MAYEDKKYLDLPGLQTYDGLIKGYVRSMTSGIPEYVSATETLVFGGGGTGGTEVNDRTLNSDN